MPLTGPARPLTGAGMRAELARLGPFFALDSHPARSVPALPWRPFDELFRRSDALEARVAAVRGALARACGRSADTVELRVAASMAQLGLAGRLICPALGVAVLTGGLLDADPARMRWQPGAGSTVALSVPDDVLASAAGQDRAVTAAGQDRAVTAAGQDRAVTTQDAAVLADALAANLLAGPVRALVEASRTFGVSEQLLWGNVASVVSGAAGLIGGAAPGLAGRAQLITAGLLHLPPLRGTHQGGGTDGDRGTFRRRSCCLVYRLTDAPGPVCGDCVLDRAPTRRTSMEPNWSG